MRGVIVVAAFLQASASDPEQALFGPVVTTEFGKVEGYTRFNLELNVDCFLGMPFAAPPMGQNRFRPPQPFTDAWAPKTREAKTPRQICDQLDIAGNLHIGGEDCLYLNVYRPSGADSDSLLPVFFWIYGGGYFIGDGIEFTVYDGTHLVKAHRYVVVNHNYRLSGFGFMALPELAAEDADGTTGNYGVQDQRAALQWVQRNIKNFGGNPSRVTIAGESAGAFSVTWHTVSRASRGLFHAAISESGTSHNQMFFQNMSEAYEFYSEWSEILGCPTGAARLSCLRALPQKNFMISFAEMGKDIARRMLPFPLPKDIPDFASPLWPLMPFGPVIDGTDVGLHDQPYTLMTQGDFAKVPLIIGGNKDDGAYFGPILPALWGDLHWNFSETLEWFLSDPSDRARGMEIYGDSFPNDEKRMNQFIRDLTFTCSTRDVATAWSDAGLQAYMYVFSFDFNGKLESEKMLGDAHAFELPFVFKNYAEVLGALSKNSSAAAYEHMSDIMSCSWASFVNCHTPKCVAAPPGCEVLKKIPDWPVFSSHGRNFYSLKSEPTVEALGPYKAYGEDEMPGDDRCDFIKSVNMDWQPIRKKISRAWLDKANSGVELVV